MIIEMPMNLKNKTKEELVSLLQDSCSIIEKLQKENAQFRTKPNCKDKIINEMAKELYHRVDNGVFGDSVEEIIDYFRKKEKDE